jgi:adenosylcobinamide kinase/adenosylcobinamide-phosphate guanylyltransferase
LCSDYGLPAGSPPLVDLDEKFNWRRILSKKCILIIGGAGSGKSHFAQELASKLGETVLFVATAEAGDEEMRQRIEEHKRRRPAAWGTLEVTTQVGSQILEKIGDAQVVIVDCITLLVNNIFSQCNDQTGKQIDAPLIEKRLMTEVGELIECINRLDAGFIIVTNEVGLGLVPANRLGRLYRDLLARANRMLAQTADEVYLMVAGLPVPIKPAKK